MCTDFLIFLYIFSVRLLLVLRGHSFFFIPATTANDLRLRRIFYPRFYPLHLFFYLYSWEKASIFPFKCSVLNKGTTGTIFITSLVWRGPWLGIEPGTSRTRSQHYTTRLSRRQYCNYLLHYMYNTNWKKTHSTLWYKAHFTRCRFAFWSYLY